LAEKGEKHAVIIKKMSPNGMEEVGGFAERI
jgi:hypothetical protein